MRADVFAEGHDAINVGLRWRTVNTAGKRGQVVRGARCSRRATTAGARRFLPVELGRVEYEVFGWSDRPSTWQYGLLKKVEAGGRRQRRTAGRQAHRPAPAPARQRRTAPSRRTTSLKLDGSPTTSPKAAPRHSKIRAGASCSGCTPTVSRSPRRVRCRSTSIPSGHASARGTSSSRVRRSTRGRGHGTLADAIERLALRRRDGLRRRSTSRRSTRSAARSARAATTRSTAGARRPRQPVGHRRRRGRPQGRPPRARHDRRLRPPGRQAPTALGIELALDIAFQCSPDHPWVREHPEWFRHRPDGTIQYAENPPKKYQDIYPLDFECDDWRALWDAAARRLRLLDRSGVTIFRVDNPHTKPFPFWEWLIAEVRDEHPEAIFLAEAFTRPR